MTYDNIEYRKKNFLVVKIEITKHRMDQNVITMNQPGMNPNFPGQYGMTVQQPQPHKSRKEKFRSCMEGLFGCTMCLFCINNCFWCMNNFASFCF